MNRNKRCMYCGVKSGLSYVCPNCRKKLILIRQLQEVLKPLKDYKEKKGVN